jgi:hypothetical protein
VRLLADESVDMGIVRAVRDAGHDVRAVAEESPGASDGEVADLAHSDKRLLITEDRDFGRLVYADQRDSHGVVYVRYPAGARAEVARDVVNLIANEGVGLSDAFVVMQPGRARISRLNDPQS